jgi:hypothetical protein
MKKLGIILTSSTTKDVVMDNIVIPLKHLWQCTMTVNDDILRCLFAEERSKAEELIVKEIKKFKLKKIYNIVFACSSISYFKRIAVKEGVNIFAIDDFISKELFAFKRIALLSTAETALRFSDNLFNNTQAVDKYLIKNAFEFLSEGNRKEHNKLIVNFILSLADSFDCIVLAQISMLYAIKDILSATKIPTLSGITTLVKNLLSLSSYKTVKMYDSISYVSSNDKNNFIISGSHGGIPSSNYAIDKKVFGAVFNDAGIGKNNAGILGLSILEKKQILGITVSADSAEIGNSKDTYTNGIISHYNETAKNYGAQNGIKIKDFIRNISA